jgi:hypothetical protein
VLKSPNQAPADETEVSSLLSEITGARATEVASETGEDLVGFKLSPPEVSVAARLEAGGEKQIILGTKTEGESKTYYAKNSDRSQIFKVEASLFDKLNVKPAQLRSKDIVKLDVDTLTRAHLKNPNLTFVAEKNTEGKWLIKEPAAKKDKDAPTTRFLDPIQTTKATEIVDKPSASILAKLAKPAVEVRFTTKDGKSTVVKVSAADGEDAYVRVEGRPEVFKVRKQLLDDLSFKAEDLN